MVDARLPIVKSAVATLSSGYGQRLGHRQLLAFKASVAGDSLTRPQTELSGIQVNECIGGALRVWTLLPAKGINGIDGSTAARQSIGSQQGGAAEDRDHGHQG